MSDNSALRAPKPALLCLLTSGTCNKKCNLCISEIKSKCKRELNFKNKKEVRRKRRLGWIKLRGMLNLNMIHEIQEVLAVWMISRRPGAPSFMHVLRHRSEGGQYLYYTHIAVQLVDKVGRAWRNFCGTSSRHSWTRSSRAIIEPVEWVKDLHSATSPRTSIVREWINSLEWLSRW